MVLWQAGIPQPVVGLLWQAGVPQPVVVLLWQEGIPQPVVGLLWQEGIPQPVVALVSDTGDALYSLHTFLPPPGSCHQSGHFQEASRQVADTQSWSYNDDAVDRLGSRHFPIGNWVNKIIRAAVGTFTRSPVSLCMALPHEWWRTLHHYSWFNGHEFISRLSSYFIADSLLS